MTIEIKLRDAEAEVVRLRTEVETRDAQLATAKTELEGERARAAKLERRAVVLEVETLVGVKITPAEREDFVDMALTNRSMFERMIANRHPMTLLQRVVPDGDGPERETAMTDNGASLARSVFGKDTVTK